MAEVPPVLILTGPPGAGKSTLARLLAEASERPAVHIHTDDFFAYVIAGYIEPWLPESRAQNHTISRAIAAAACQYALGGFSVIVDGIVGPWHLPMYEEEARKTGAALDYVVLSLDRETCVARAREREVQPLQDYPPRIYEQLAELGPYAPHALDVTGLPPERAAAAIREGLVAGRFRLG